MAVAQGRWGLTSADALGSGGAAAVAEPRMVKDAAGGGGTGKDKEKGTGKGGDEAIQTNHKLTIQLDARVRELDEHITTEDCPSRAG